MAIKIHHGPNGSYKTSGAIQDDAVPALLAGRVIITNIRGFTLERCYEVFPNLPETTEIINLDLENLEDLEKMRTWMHWVPQGAFIIFDETQLLFPKSWREKDLEKFEYPGGAEAAKEANRPFNWLDAWTRHRHFGWDIVLTTPNISYIRDDIRMTCEMAYRHANLAVIGIKGRYKESQHDAQVNRPPLEGTVIEYKKIKPRTFRLYQSTATGEVRDTFAGKNMLKSPKLLFLLAFLAACLVFVLSMGPVKFAPNPEPEIIDSVDLRQGDSPSSVGYEVPDKKTTNSPSDFLPSSLEFGAGNAPDVLTHPFSNHEIKIVAKLSMSAKGNLYAFEFKDSDGRVFIQNSRQLLHTGYLVTRASDCYAVLVYDKENIPVTCKGSSIANQAVNQFAMQQEPIGLEPEQDKAQVTVIPHVRGEFLW